MLTAPTPPNAVTHELTNEELAVIQDLSYKMVADAMESISPTLNLIMETGGPNSAIVSATLTAKAFIEGAALYASFVRSGSKENLTATMDDKRFIALTILSIFDGPKGRTIEDAFGRAAAMFRSQYGYDYPVPESWVTLP